ncbi:MAG TPA: PASTA domain-containing protein [Desulfonatronum sp.]|nr:PASTA domain-containing protein [Desulfonatronum sp.]
MSRKYIKNTPGRDWVRLRMGLLWALMVLLWLGLWGRAYQVQVLQGPELTSMALRQHRAAEFERGARGQILDRQGRILAKSTSIQSVYVRPLEIENLDAAATTLAAALDLPAARIRADLGKTRNFVWLARQISDRNARKVLDAGLRGVYLTEESARFYPHGHLAGQLLGFVGLDGDGLEGIERSFDEVLAGKKATFVAQRDASGRRMYLDAQGREEDLCGANVTLTLDSQVQFFAEEALARTVASFQGKSGQALVVDVHSNDILALANYPFFNPNMPRTDPEQWRNRVSMDALEPGSTLKPLLMAAALEEGVCTRDSQYFCEQGLWRITGVSIKDTKPHGWLPVHKVLRYSSNICSAKIGMDLGASRYHAYLHKLGFGQRTGLNMPGENPGLLRPPKSWHPVDLAAASFGQGISANALQMARAYLTLANNGVLKPLRIVRDPAGEEAPVTVLFRQEVAQAVMDMMREVVEEDGTGTRARIPGLSGAGKTGTAQKVTDAGTYGDRYVASFAGFYPATRPEYFIFVVVDEPHPQHYGGVVAAPAVREIGLRTLAYAGKLSEDAESVETAVMPSSQWHSATAAANRVDQEPAGEDQEGIPSLIGLSLRRAVERLRSAGVMPSVQGRGGVVSRQEPEAGVPWPDQDRNVTLWLEPT